MTARLAPARGVATAPTEVAAPSRAFRRRPWLVFTVVVLAAFFGLIGSRISLDESAFTIDRLEDEISTARARNLDLQLEIAELRDPDRIAARAEAMGMTFPGRQIPLAVDASGAGRTGASPGSAGGGP